MYYPNAALEEALVLANGDMPSKNRASGYIDSPQQKNDPNSPAESMVPLAPWGVFDDETEALESPKKSSSWPQFGASPTANQNSDAKEKRQQSQTLTEEVMRRPVIGARSRAAISDAKALAKAREDYDARPKDTLGRMLPTATSPPALSPKAKTQDLGSHKLTQSEEIREFFVDQGRKHTSAGLLREKEEYSARPKDAEGRILWTVSKGPIRNMMTNTQSVHNNLVLTQSEEIANVFMDQGRKHTSAGLLKEKTEYNARPKDAEGRILSTVSKGPIRNMMTNTQSVHNNFVLTQSEEIADVFIDQGRKHTSAGLLKEKAEYNARPKDEEGRILSTVSKGPVRNMMTNSRSVHNNLVFTQKEQEIADFHTPGRALIGSVLSAAKEAYVTRPRTKSGLHVQVTVGSAPFSWAEQRAAQRALERPQAPPTDYESRGAAGPTAVGLKKLELDRRAQLAVHLEEESAKFKFRMRVRQKIMASRRSQSADRVGQRLSAEPVEAAGASAAVVADRAHGGGAGRFGRGGQQRGRSLARSPRGETEREVRVASCDRARGTSLDRHTAAAQRRQQQQQQQQPQLSPHYRHYAAKVPRSNAKGSKARVQRAASEPRTLGGSKPIDSRSIVLTIAATPGGNLKKAFEAAAAAGVNNELDLAKAGVFLSPHVGAYAHTKPHTGAAAMPELATPPKPTTKRAGADSASLSPSSVSSGTGPNSSSGGSIRNDNYFGHGDPCKSGHSRSAEQTTSNALQTELAAAGMKRPLVRRPGATAASAERDERSPRRSRSVSPAGRQVGLMPRLGRASFGVDPNSLRSQPLPVKATHRQQWSPRAPTSLPPPLPVMLERLPASATV
jgi:hypothetical protein